VYTFILKDELPGKDAESGREKATVSWEVDFRVADGGKEEEEGTGKGRVLFMPWKDFKPTYRGKEKNGIRGLDLKKIRRMSLMMRR
jgi:Complex I intermediate-associated protein 30 (CIA30)